MRLPKLENLNFSGKKVLVRTDLDVERGDFRLEVLMSTLKYLIGKQAKVILLGHRGRPKGQIDGKLSLAPVAERLGKLLGQETKFVYDLVGEEARRETDALGPGKVMMLENLRFDSREEENDSGFAKALAGLGDFYVNEAFANSHRQHASIVSLPRLLPHAAGPRFIKEVENLSQVLKNPKRPLVVIIGGAKRDKLDYIKAFKKFADRILVGGRLPDYLGDEDKDEKVVFARLVPDKEDITANSVERFEDEIKRAGTIVLAGPVGKYEEKSHIFGTRRVFEAVASSSAFKVAGGRETQKALSIFNLENKFDWISVGGGAMLEFLAKRTLPGIRALLN